MLEPSDIISAPLYDAAMAAKFSHDIGLVGAIDAVPSILEVVCQATGMGFAAVARVTEDRWIACSVRDEIAFGLEPGGELKIETTICNEIRAHRTPVIIEDVDKDPVYSKHHTPQVYGLKSYIAFPIILSDGTFFGTLCAISPKPAPINQPKILGMFKLFADMIGHHIEAGRSVEMTKTALLDEQQTSALREQFIAVLGHDLRNPLAGIMGGMRLLRTEELSEQGETVATMIDATVARMSGLIDNVMDFARGRLGGGLRLAMSRANVAMTLKQVIGELQSSHPDATIHTDIQTDLELNGDHSRLGQLFSNLLGNALQHGDADMPVHAALRVEDGELIFQVTNVGDPIPDDAMEMLFAPFSRGEVRSSLQGLGLGLYIASQIAEAHQGKLSAESVGRETTFTFRMPAGLS